MSHMSKSADLLQGTLDLLILRTLELQPLHGVGVADRLEQVTRGVFVVGPGSLFPALHRLPPPGVGGAARPEQVPKGVFVVGPGSLFPALHRLADRGWIEGEWGELETGRRA